MPRIRYSHNPRAAARLLSTPSPQETAMGKSTITLAGVKVPDPAMADLLIDAMSQGFRVEPSSGTGGHAANTGFVVYPPNPEHAPLRVGCVEINPKHVANVRSNLRAAGYVTGQHREATTPAPRTATAPKETAVPTTARKQNGTRKSTATQNPAVYDTQIADVVASDVLGPMGHLTGPVGAIVSSSPAQRRTAMVGALGDTLEAIGVSPRAAALATLLIDNIMEFDQNADRVDNSDLLEALRLAEEAEQRATRAEAAKAKAEEKGAETGRLLTEALARAEKAEAEAASLRKALDPLRALLNGDA